MATIKKRAKAKVISGALALAKQVGKFPSHKMWLDYDAEADVLYINFKKPSLATDSELTDDDVIIRYEKDQVIGFTVLHASKRPSAA